MNENENTTTQNLWDTVKAVLRGKIIAIQTYIKKQEKNKIKKAKILFFDRLNKIDKPLARLNKKQREKNQINKIRNENGEITIDHSEIQRIITDYCQRIGRAHV